MRRIWQLAAALAIVGGAAFLVFRRPQPAPVVDGHVTLRKVGHAEGIDQNMASILALLKAPEGATPCETAFNAYQHSLDVAKEQRVKSAVIRLAPRDEFLATCGALPADVQQCMVPRYDVDHKRDCDKVRWGETDDVRDKVSSLVEVVRPEKPARPPLPAASQ